MRSIPNALAKLWQKSASCAAGNPKCDHEPSDATSNWQGSVVRSEGSKLTPGTNGGKTVHRALAAGACDTDTHTHTYTGARDVHEQTRRHIRWHQLGAQLGVSFPSRFHGSIEHWWFRRYWVISDTASSAFGGSLRAFLWAVLESRRVWFWPGRAVGAILIWSAASVTLCRVFYFGVNFYCFFLSSFLFLFQKDDY